MPLVSHDMCNPWVLVFLIVFCVYLQDLGGLWYFTAGALAKAVATIVTYPMQVVQTKQRVSKKII